MKKPLFSCVLCRDCANMTVPNTFDILTSKDMAILGYSSCFISGNTYLVNADRKCGNFKGKTIEDKKSS